MQHFKMLLFIAVFLFIVDMCEENVKRDIDAGSGYE